MNIDTNDKYMAISRMVVELHRTYYTLIKAIKKHKIQPITIGGIPTKYYSVKEILAALNK